VRRYLRLGNRGVVGWSVPLAAIAIVVGAAAAFGALGDSYTPPTAPVPGKGLSTFLAMKGQKTGIFNGGTTQKGREGQIQVIALDFGLKSPHDPVSGLPTGKTVCEAVNFRKPTDQSTPLLLNAISTNENITSAVFNEFRTTTQGSEQQFFTVELTNSSLAAVHAVTATTTGAYDDVTLIPQRVKVTWKPGGVIATYDCTSRPT
jgi:type VI secretion system secreted protein Hcp